MPQVARLRPQCGESTSLPRVTVIYSGRFFGNLTPTWYDNHLRNLIRPNNATVILVADPENWCHAPPHATDALATAAFATAERALREEARRAFRGWANLHVALLPLNDPSSSAWRRAMLREVKPCLLQQELANTRARHPLKLRYNRRLQLAADGLTNWLRQFANFGRAVLAG